jgi:DNA invertase Pin-like site-specific DNA recombinase
MPRKAALYLRLSNDTEASSSIARQEADLRGLAAREGWIVSHVLSDESISGRKARANADEALRLLRSGEADILAVWKLDRWTRQGLGAVGTLIDTLDATPGALFVAMQDGLRSDQPAWRLIAAVLSEVARTEAENTATRVKSAVKSMRLEGRWPGGIVPFGYWPAPNPAGAGRILLPHPPEVAVIRDVADRILAGESLTRIASDLAARSIPTSRSDYRLAEIAGRQTEGLDRGTWRLSAIKLVWSADYLLGRVTHHGELVRDENGVPAQIFEPILDLGTLTRLRARLGEPRRGKPATAPRRARAARLLSGLAYCAYCGHKMYVGTANGKPTYRCPQGSTPGTCPGVRVNADVVEAYISERYLSVVGAEPELEEVEVVTDPGTAADLAEAETAIQETLAALGDDEADTPALLRRLESLKAHRAQLRNRPASVAVSARPTGRTRAQAWAASDSDGQRALLLDAMDHVLVGSAVKRGNVFDSDRVSIVWLESVDYDLDGESRGPHSRPSFFS